MSKTVAAVPFEKFCRAVGLPEPVREHRFDEIRRFRFDYAWLPQKVALECDGGVWTRGRHTRGSGYLRDIDKLNLATSKGWRVFRCTPQTLHTNYLLDMLREALK